ncbi:30S ribosomal protein S5 [Patescibacteria group bacterium]|nr:30S ribosomal protein S5 [Patescibacteria group bacterium]MBU4142257.1 30S ribosomal protein S5 [Patescibacteria group bacterium]MBU4339165.1 30S ribosomal protein S5 [Patescibacteria group bacterium]MBU4580586.1 30S ribosomal protein S5 [Patescibacteria group bacterium]
MMRNKREKSEYDQKLLEASRVARVVKGGKRFSFRALVVIGNRKGKVSVGVDKGADLTDATQKAVTNAKKAIITVPIINGSIPHEVYQKYGASKVLLKPAPKGSGIIAGGAVRVILELAGVANASGKILGSANKLNCARATIMALGNFKSNARPFNPQVKKDAGAAVKGATEEKVKSKK